MAELGALETMAVQGAQEAMAVQGAQEAMAVQGAQETKAVQGAQEAMAVQGAQEAMAVQGAQEAMAVQGAQETKAVQGAQETMTGGRSPRPSPYSRNPYYPPQKKFPGVVRGYQEPSGAKQTGQYKTGQESPPGPEKQDKTGLPTGTGSPPGLAWKLRLLLGMTRHQGPSQGSLSYRFHIRDTGEAAGNGLLGHD